MKPFLLLSTRAEDAIADAERDAFVRLGGLRPNELHSIRMDRAPLPALELADYSGVLVGGSPFNASDPDESKSAAQHRVERELAELLDVIVDRDFPFFGACYGIGTLGTHQGGVVDRRYGEAVGAIEVTLTDAGRSDALFAQLPVRFAAFVGHKEACSALPPNAVLLATGSGCPVQAFRVKSNLYATQFHPELTLDDLIARIHAYRFNGYFDPQEMDTTIASARSGASVTWPSQLIRNFVARYAVDH